MANYTVKFACGHEGQVSLVGKGDERRRKIAYFETSGMCKECYKKQMQEQAKEAAKEKTAKVDITTEYNEVVVTMILSGEHDAEQLKQAGYANNKKVIRAKSQKELEKQLAPVMSEVKEMGYKYDFEHGRKLLASMRDEMNAAWNKTDAEIESEKQKANSKPNDNCYDFMREKHGDDFQRWNKKIYGGKGYYNYYINGEKFSMSDEQCKAIVTYREKLKEWKVQ